MPLDAEKLDELKSNIAFARKRPLAFGLCLGKSAETTVLLSHKTKDPETVGRLAKKEGETTKIAFGMMAVEAKNLNFMCHGDVIPGLARKTKEMLKAAGIKMKVRILDAEGNLLEDDGDEDEDGEAKPAVARAAAPTAEADPQKEKWTATRPRIADALATLAADGKLDLTQPQAAWAVALAKAEAGDFAGALLQATEAARLIAAASAAAKVLEAERARWTEMAAQIGPAIQELGKAATPEVKKIAAYWALAQSKAAGPAPDFATSLKSAATLVKMIAEYRSKKAQEAKAKERADAVAARGTPPDHYVNGAPPVNSEENEKLKLMSDEDLAKADLTLGDPKVLFGNDYMQKLKDAKFKGEGNPNLKALMREVDKGMSDDRTKEVMILLAQIVGDPPSSAKLTDDHARFLILRRQQGAIGKKKKKQEVPSLDEKKHDKFMASRGQLMFGKVLGDAFGIHEVFAALLSPTGGLVGADNSSLHLAADNPVAIHGTVHDAAGYMASYHEDGPGYNYLNSNFENLIFDNLPLPDYLAGQLSGVPFWIKEAGADYAGRLVDDAAVMVEKKLKEARDAVQAEIDLKIAQAKRKALDIAHEAEKKAKLAENKALEVADAIQDAGGKAKKATVDTLEDAAKGLKNVKDEAKKKLESAWKSIWS
ncbi:MAG: hypothetical protein ACK4L4_12345 [Gemmobacter sp.]